MLGMVVLGLVVLGLVQVPFLMTERRKVSPFDGAQIRMNVVFTLFFLGLVRRKQMPRLASKLCSTESISGFLLRWLKTGRIRFSAG
jgi:hypothetical protein